MMKRSTYFWSLTALIASLFLGTGQAQLRDERLTRQLLEGLPGEQAQQRVDFSTPMSPSEAARKAQGRHGGEVLSVEPAMRGYRVKLLVDGEVRFVNVMP